LIIPQRVVHLVRNAAQRADRLELLALPQLSFIFSARAPADPP
jgi:hypothetical protein